jgi:AcrR family transcriptional regulator
MANDTPRGRAAPARRVESLVLGYASRRPELGQFRVAASLGEQGIRISPSGVRAIWKRHGLETVYKRLSALGKSGRHVRLTEGQHARLRRAKLSHEILNEPTDDRQRERAALRRLRLLTVAAQAFARKGYQGTTLQDVAQSAGLLAGSMYHYFRSKQDLFVEVHQEGFRQLNEAVDRALEGVDDPWQRLEAAFTAHLERLVSGTAITAFAGRAMFSPDRADLRRRLMKDRDAYENRIRQLVEALPPRPGVDSTLLRLQLLGALNWTQNWFKPGRKSPAELARHLVALVRR